MGNINKQDKINTIYQKIANKELSNGCKVDLNGNTLTIIRGALKCYLLMDLKGQYKTFASPSKFEIIGHNVLIGDVLEYGQLNGLWLCSMNDYSDRILLLWKYKRLPIEEQSEECINYIYNLLIKVK